MTAVLLKTKFSGMSTHVSERSRSRDTHKSIIRDSDCLTLSGLITNRAAAADMMTDRNARLDNKILWTKFAQCSHICAA